MRPANEQEFPHDESLEDEHFFLWEPARETAYVPKDVPRLLCTVMDASSALSLSRSKVYELINAGMLPTVHVGRSIRLPVADLESFVQRQMSKTSNDD